MNNIVPFKNNFSSANKLDTLSDISLCLSTILLIIGYLFKNKFEINSIILSSIEILNSILIVLIFVLSFFIDKIYCNAQNLRREDLVDNSFGSKLCENQSVNYYTNDNIQFGFIKLGINNFESSFFTYRILKETIKKEILKAFGISLLFLVIAICGFDKALIFILQLSIPFIILLRLYRKYVLYENSKSVFDTYRSIFDKADKVSTNIFIADIVKNVLVYESSLSWSCILLDDATYKRMNETLSAEWEDIKVRYALM